MDNEDIVIRPHAGRPPTSDKPDAIAERAARIERKRNGWCSMCGRRKPRNGRKLCRRCAKQIRASNKVIRDRRRAAGECLECGEPADGRVRCPRCVRRRAKRPSRQTEYRRPEQARWHRQRKKRVARWNRERRCVDCGGECAAGNVRCDRHRAIYAANMERSRAADKAARAARAAARPPLPGLSCQEAAVLVGITSTSMRRAALDGRLPYVRIGIRWRFTRVDVEEFARCRNLRR